MSQIKWTRDEQGNHISGVYRIVRVSGRYTLYADANVIEKRLSLKDAKERVEAIVEGLPSFDPGEQEAPKEAPQQVRGEAISPVVEQEVNQCLGAYIDFLLPGVDFPPVVEQEALSVRDQGEAPVDLSDLTQPADDLEARERLAALDQAARTPDSQLSQYELEDHPDELADNYNREQIDALRQKIYAPSAERRTYPDEAERQIISNVLSFCTKGEARKLRKELRAQGRPHLAGLRRVVQS